MNQIQILFLKLPNVARGSVVFEDRGATKVVRRVGEEHGSGISPGT